MKKKKMYVMPDLATYAVRTAPLAASSDNEMKIGDELIDDSGDVGFSKKFWGISDDDKPFWDN